DEEALQACAQASKPSVRGVLSSRPKGDAPDQPDKALQLLAKLPADPAFMRAHLVVLRLAGVAQFQKKDFAKAEKLLKAYLAIDPNNVMAWRELASIYGSEGNAGQRAGCLEKSDALQKRLAAAMIAQARESMERNQP